MSLKTFVKINRITNLTDARYCAGMYANVIGFSLEADSPQYVSPSQFVEITGWISGIEFSAEFKKASSNEILAALEQYPGIKWIESEQLKSLLDLKVEGLNLIYKLPIEELDRKDEISEKIKNHPITFHLTSKDNTLTADHLAHIQALSSLGKVILGFGISAENAAELSEHPNISGLALDSGDEIKPGLRDFDQLADILEALELDN